MDDALPVLRRLWAGEVVSHDGPAGSFADVSVSPRPVQDPFDVWLGGNLPAALERCGRLADGWIPAFCTPEDAAAGKRVIDEVAAAQRARHQPRALRGQPRLRPRRDRPRRRWPSSPLARRARGRPLEQIVPVGLGGLRAMIGRSSRSGSPSSSCARWRRPASWRPRSSSRLAAERRRPADLIGPASARPVRCCPCPNAPLTLMAVHAHPDDEAIGTGGILARYSDEGVRTVLVTCTNGELGDAPGGLKPGDPGHDEDVVVPLRRRELEASCEVLGVSQLELLGYHDSGMEGWPQNDAPDSFWRTPVEEAGAPPGRADAHVRAAGRRHLRRERLLRAPRPHSGQPGDTRRARSDRGIPAKLYYTAVARSRRCGGFRAMMAEARHRGAEEVEENPDFGTPDELITTDGRLQRRRRAQVRLARRPRQPERQHLLPADGRGAVRHVMGSESFVRVSDSTGAPVPEDDLFAGLR